jgi:hypothetical protein
MRRDVIISIAVISLIGWTYGQSTKKKLVDDAYYWPEHDTIVNATPVYDKNMHEFIFLEDTVQHPDTVRMHILDNR